MTAPPASPPNDLLFVYGTLRRGNTGAQARRLAQESDWLGAAQIRGELYRIGTYPGLRVGGAGSSTGGSDEPVAGELFRLHEPAVTLDWLDAYEETGHAFPEPWEYRRLLLPVDTADGQRAAWIYIYNRSVEGFEKLAHGDWMKRPE